MGRISLGRPSHRRRFVDLIKFGLEKDIVKPRRTCLRGFLFFGTSWLNRRFLRSGCFAVRVLKSDQHRSTAIATASPPPMQIASIPSVRPF